VADAAGPDDGSAVFSDDDIALIDAARDGLAAKLGELYEASSERDRALLVHVLYRAMDPLARAEIANPDLISPDQEAVLERIDRLTAASNDG
jgi:hypothetical protein